MKKSSRRLPKSRQKLVPFRSILLVEWRDAASRDGWHPKHEATEDHAAGLRCRSVGFLVKSDRGALSLAHTDGLDNESAAGMITIPRGMVAKVTVLRR